MPWLVMVNHGYPWLTMFSFRRFVCVCVCVSKVSFKHEPFCRGVCFLFSKSSLFDKAVVKDFFVYTCLPEQYFFLSESFCQKSTFDYFLCFLLKFLFKATYVSMLCQCIPTFHPPLPPPSHTTKHDTTNGWMAGWMPAWMPACRPAWLAGCRAGLLDGWLAGWLALGGSWWLAA